MWSVLCSLGIFAICFACLETWDRYYSSGTVTVVETTRYQNSEIPFPSVTICDVSTDWGKVMALTEDDLPAPFNESMPQAMKLLEKLGNVGWGDFDYLDQIRNSKVNLSALKTVNLTKLLLKVIRPCHEVFESPCWWRDSEYPCCDIFELQKTDHGFCWAFNSDTSELILSNPRSIPQGWYSLVQAGMQGMFAVWGDSIKAKDKIRTLRRNIRNCLFEDENESQRFGKLYSYDNCMYQCAQDYAVKVCNCTPDFLMPDTPGYELPPCNVDGLLCLSINNNFFNTIGPQHKSEFFEPGHGMICNCPSECNGHQYITELYAPFQGNETVDQTSIDVHFRSYDCVLYSTSIENDWLDTLVAFGGIAGLFLGASLMSCVELLYFFTVRLLRHYIVRKYKRRAATTSSYKIYIN